MEPARITDLRTLSDGSTLRRALDLLRPIADGLPRRQDRLRWWSYYYALRRLDQDSDAMRTVMRDALDTQAVLPFAQPDLTATWRDALVRLSDLDLARLVLGSSGEASGLRRYNLVTDVLRPCEARLATEYATLAAPERGLRAVT